MEGCVLGRRGVGVCVIEGEGCEEELWEWTEMVGPEASHSRRVIS